MEVISCKDFKLIITGGNTYFQTALQTKRLTGRRSAIDRLVQAVNHDTTMSDLMCLFYSRDEDGNAEKQIIYYTHSRRIEGI